MPRLLLSQSQVSLVASFTVIATFTLLLFLSGYVIQQRTLISLQTAIKPRLPPPPPLSALRRPDSQHAAPPDIHPSRLFTGQGRVAYTNLDAAAQTSAQVNWQRLAHVQLVASHHAVCSAVMVLAELHRLKSPARRVLLFPRAWAVEPEGKRGEVGDPFLASSRRLMRMAARRYGVELRPLAPLVGAGLELGHGVKEDDDAGPGAYSLASAFALTDFDRVLSIETPGLLRDALPLDAVLAFTEAVPFAMLQDTAQGDGVHSEDLLLLQPSATAYASLLERLTTTPINPASSPLRTNTTAFTHLFTDPLLLASTTNSQTLIRSIGTLHSASTGPTNAEKNIFNATAFLSDVAYIRFSDPKLPGPEYDVPWSAKVAARPRNKDADWVWTKLYGEFAQKRVDICGLDLDTWRG